MTSSLIEPGQSLASLLIAIPALAPRLAAHGVDIGCSGHRPSAQICERSGVDWNLVMGWSVEATVPSAQGCACARASEMTLPELVTHIIECHHRRVESMLDKLRPEAVRWANSAPAEDCSLKRFAREFVTFANQVREHFAREQRHGFCPLLKLAQADVNPPPGSLRPEIGRPLAVLFLDHDHVHDSYGNILQLVGQDALRRLSCPLGARVLAGLTDLRTELGQMMHEENNLLFTLGIGVERARATRGAIPASPRHLDRGVLAAFTELRAYRGCGRRPEQ